MLVQGNESSTSLSLPEQLLPLTRLLGGWQWGTSHGGCRQLPVRLSMFSAALSLTDNPPLPPSTDPAG